jgi:hypothetical protein
VASNNNTAEYGFEQRASSSSSSVNGSSSSGPEEVQEQETQGRANSWQWRRWRIVEEGSPSGHKGEVCVGECLGLGRADAVSRNRLDGYSKRGRESGIDS